MGLGIDIFFVLESIFSDLRLNSLEEWEREAQLIIKNYYIPPGLTFHAAVTSYSSSLVLLLSS